MLCTIVTLPTTEASVWIVPSMLCEAMSAKLAAAITGAPRKALYGA